MVKRIEQLGDRLLTRLVPKAQASAVICWCQICAYQRYKYCCTGEGANFCLSCGTC
jgi:hypothetical protein